MGFVCFVFKSVGIMKMCTLRYDLPKPTFHLKCEKTFHSFPFLSLSYYNKAMFNEQV